VYSRFSSLYESQKGFQFKVKHFSIIIGTQLKLILSDVTLYENKVEISVRQNAVRTSRTFLDFYYF